MPVDAYTLISSACYAAVMGNKMCPKIILEGTRLTFKTDLAFELNEQHYMPD